MSWANPIPIIPENDYNSNPPLIFFDRGYRNKCGTLMHIPGWGAKYADMALTNISFQDLLVIEIHDSNRHFREPGGLGGTQPALPRHQLVVIADLPYHQGLQDTVRANALPQGGQLVRVKRFPGLEGVILDPIDGNLSRLGGGGGAAVVRRAE